MSEIDRNCKLPESHLHWNEWAINKIRVRAIYKNTVYIEYYKYGINQPTETEVVSYNLIDKKLRKISFEEKISNRLDMLKLRLSKENEIIVMSKELEKRYNNNIKILTQ